MRAAELVALDLSRRRQSEGFSRVPGFVPMTELRLSPNDSLFWPCPGRLWPEQMGGKMKVITFDSNLRKNLNITHKRDFIKTKLTKLIAIATKFFNVRDKLPTICVFGRDDPFKLVTPVQEDYEQKRLDCRCYSFDSNLDQILTHDKPQVIIQSVIALHSPA